MLNPSIQPTGTWSFNSYYAHETPLTKLMTYGTSTTPKLANATV